MSETHKLPLRVQRLTACIDLEGQGIEYGPLHHPLLTRKNAPGIRYVDFADRPQLIENYRNNPKVNTDAIPEIDIVSGGKLIDAFVEPESIDYVLASHVAEHVPDLIGWLKANEKILRPGGHISVAFPDRRYTFDLTRKLSGIEDLIGAYYAKSEKPTLQQIAAHMVQAKDAVAADIWSGKVTPQNAPPKRTLEQAIAVVEKIAKSDAYHDVHCWIFSDQEFLTVVTETLRRFVPQLAFVSFLPTLEPANEFIFTLRKL